MTTMKIGVIGTGAIGGFYGALLALAGHDVHFLLRSEYDAVLKHGLHIDSQVLGKLHLDQVNAYDRIEAMPPCDWLLVAVKTTANDSLVPLLNKAAAPHGRVILMQNGFGVEDAIRPQLRDDLHLLAGLCAICAYRDAPGRIVHQALGSVNLAYHSGPSDEGQAVAKQALDLFQQSNIEARLTDSVEKARWMKLVWNLPFNGLSVAKRANTLDLLDDPVTHQALIDLMEEVMKAAAARGFPLPAALPENMLEGTRAMGDYWPSMYHDFVHKRPMELDAIYRNPIEAAQAAGVEMPKARVLLEFLQALSI